MNIKKIVYHFLMILLGVLLSFILHAVIEITYINHLLEKEYELKLSDSPVNCFLPRWLQITLPLLGAFCGLLLGKWGWRVVYEEKRRRIAR